jgi:glycosyltransferase involved in cell wall biosynthesis
VSTRVRVVHVITRMNVGGAAGFVLDVCRCLSPERFEQLVVTGPAPECEGSLVGELAELGVETHVVAPLARAPHPLRDVRAARAVREALRSLRPDVVHTHTAKAGFVGRWAAHSLGVPALHHVHGWASLNESGGLAFRAYLQAERLAARWCTRILTVTPRDTARGLALGIGTSDQYALVRAGIDTRGVRAAATAGAAPEIQRLADEGPVVGFLGRLCDQKQPLAFVEAATIVAKGRPEARFLLVGDGPQRALVDRAAERSGLGPRLLRLPFRHDVASVLRSLRVLAHPSRHEGLPRLLLEAFAVGTPVVATPVGGCAELLDAERNALVVPPGDPAALARAITRLLGEPGLGPRIAGEAGASLGPYGIEAAVTALAEHYEAAARAS